MKRQVGPTKQLPRTVKRLAAALHTAADGAFGVRTGMGMSRLDCALCVVRHWMESERQRLLVGSASNRSVWRNLTHRIPHPYTEAEADFWFALIAKMVIPTHWAI